MRASAKPRRNAKAKLFIASTKCDCRRPRHDALSLSLASTHNRKGREENQANFIIIIFFSPLNSCNRRFAEVSPAKIGFILCSRVSCQFAWMRQRFFQPFFVVLLLFFSFYVSVVCPHRSTNHVGRLSIVLKIRVFCIAWIHLARGCISFRLSTKASKRKEGRKERFIAISFGSLSFSISRSLHPLVSNETILLDARRRIDCLFRLFPPNYEKCTISSNIFETWLAAKRHDETDNNELSATR